MPEMSDSTTDLGAIDSPAAANTTGASVISGGLWNSLNQTLPQGFALVISVAAARFLGPDGMGRQSFIAFTMISITQLTSEGLKESLMRSVGRRSEPIVPARCAGSCAGRCRSSCLAAWRAARY